MIPPPEQERSRNCPSNGRPGSEDALRAKDCAFRAGEGEPALAGEKLKGFRPFHKAGFWYADGGVHSDMQPTALPPVHEAWNDLDQEKEALNLLPDNAQAGYRYGKLFPLLCHTPP